MGADGDVSLGERLGVIERRLGRLEQLINVVIEKQERLSTNAEKAILFALQRMEGHIERTFEDSTNELLAEMRWQSEPERIDHDRGNDNRSSGDIHGHQG